MKLFFTLSLLLSVSVFAQTKKLTVPRLFADHMVLQQQDRVSFWGEAEPNTKLQVKGSWGNLSEITVNRTGEWFVQLQTPKAGGPYSVEITNEKENLTLNDVWIGEVWLASGQSNMEMPLSGYPNEPIDRGQQEIAEANFLQIRFFTVERRVSLKPEKDVIGKWEVCDPAFASGFSATAYFFARELHQKLQVPIGIIHSSWGGTSVEAWTSKIGLNKLNLYTEFLSQMERAASEEEQQSWFKSFTTLPIPDTDMSWRSADFGEKEAYHKKFRDKKWEEISLPGKFDEVNHLDANGVYVLRKHVQITNPSETYELHLGQVDDMDMTYVNGVLVGEMTGFKKVGLERIYKIPEGVLKKGDNVIAVQLVDIAGPGTVSGKMELISSNGSHISLAGSWKRKIVAELYNRRFYCYPLKTDLSLRPNILQVEAYHPSALYNGMIHPLHPYTFKGVIWYQGESNIGRAEEYSHTFPNLIADWRSKWDKDFPFYYVQIAPYSYPYNQAPDLSAQIREVQRRSTVIPNSGMVVTIDLGDFETIHPGNKQEIGRRLSLIALNKEYNYENLSFSGPNFVKCEPNGKGLDVYFDNNQGLKALDGEPIGFEIARADGKFILADARIEGNRIHVSHPDIIEPKYVRYGWKDFPAASIYNAFDLPASPFTSMENPYDGTK